MPTYGRLHQLGAVRKSMLEAYIWTKDARSQAIVYTDRGAKQDVWIYRNGDMIAFHVGNQTVYFPDDEPIFAEIQPR